MPSEKKHADVTATMMTIKPAPKRPTSAVVKTRAPSTATDLVIVKPMRHLAILPSAKEPVTKRMIADPVNLSGTSSLSGKSTPHGG